MISWEVLISFVVLNLKLDVAQGRKTFCFSSGLGSFDVVRLLPFDLVFLNLGFCSCYAKTSITAVSFSSPAISFNFGVKLNSIADGFRVKKMLVINCSPRPFGSLRK